MYGRAGRQPLKSVLAGVGSGPPLPRRLSTAFAPYRRLASMVMEYRAVGSSGADGGRTWVSASRADFLAAVDESLRRLGTDYIDLFQLHWPDPSTPIDEIPAALDLIVSQGKVRYLGHSTSRARQPVLGRTLDVNPLAGTQTGCVAVDAACACR